MRNHARGKFHRSMYITSNYGRARPVTVLNAPPLPAGRMPGCYVLRASRRCYCRTVRQRQHAFHPSRILIVCYFLFYLLCFCIFASINTHTPPSPFWLAIACLARSGGIFTHGERLLLPGKTAQFAVLNSHFIAQFAVRNLQNSHLKISL